METPTYSIAELVFQDYEGLLERDRLRCRDMLEHLMASPPALTAFERARDTDEEDAPQAAEAMGAAGDLIDRILRSGFAEVSDDDVLRLVRLPGALHSLQFEIFSRTMPGSYWSWAFDDRPYPVRVDSMTRPNRVAAVVSRKHDPFDPARKLIDDKAIDEYVTYHAGELARSYHKGQLLIVAVATGGCFFATDLSRKVAREGLPHRYQSILVHCYKGTESRDLIMNVEQFQGIDFGDSDVLLIDDIWDTGQTMAALVDEIALHNPRSIRVSVLLRKRHGRIHPRALSSRGPDFVGFTIPDAFVVGYGLDYDGHYRHLDDIWVYPAPDQVSIKGLHVGDTFRDDPGSVQVSTAESRPAEPPRQLSCRVSWQGARTSAPAVV